jgi:hypothetical protein
MSNMPAALENSQAANPSSVIALQQHYGNRAMRRVVQRLEQSSTDGAAPATPRAGRNLNSVPGPYRHLALLHHPGKSTNPADMPWRSQWRWP